jgi:DNA-binding NarL/FixJ family response regulator
VYVGAAIDDVSSGAVDEITAVVADAYPLWLEAVELVLDDLGVLTVGKATSASEAVRLIEEHQPQLLVTDLDFGADELDATGYLERIHAARPGLSIIVLASGREASEVQAAIGAGAAAYAFKDVSAADLGAAVRQVFGHTIVFASAMQRPASPVRLRVPKANVTRLPAFSGDARPTPLTRRESEILALISQGLPNAEIARRLWISEQTVKFHLTNIYRKLGVSNRTQASRWADLRPVRASRVS